MEFRRVLFRLPYPVSFLSFVSQTSECTNLLVPVCLFSSHISFFSFRMGPVFIILFQSSSFAACLAIDNNTPVQKVDIKRLQSLLKTNPLADGSTPEILVDNDDSNSITITGNWKRAPNAKGCYGPSAFVGDTLKVNDEVRFKPDIR